VTRIVLDPTELAGAASELAGTAGEYEAIGGRVASCDCGCMPGDVAAVVDSRTAAVRFRLSVLSSGLADSSGELAWRAGVPQNGASGAAISAASGARVAGNGGGATLVIGGDPYGLFTSAGSGGTTFTIGGDPYGLFSQPASAGTTLVIGGDPSGLFSQPSSGGSTLIIGGYPSMSEPNGGGYTLTIGGTPLYDPGEQEALAALWEQHLPLWQFFPRGIGVNINPPGAFLFQPAYDISDFMNQSSYNAWTDPLGSTPSHYNPYLNERVYYT
jgi:hypothetical protein